MEQDRRGVGGYFAKDWAARWLANGL